LGKCWENVGKALSLRKQNNIDMASIKFSVRGKGINSTIYVRLSDGKNTNITISTGYTINSKFWSSTGKPKQDASNSDKLNLSNKLRELETDILNQLNEDKGIKPINKEWLKHTIDVSKNPALDSKQVLLLSAIKEYQENLKLKTNKHTGKKTSPSTIRGFNTTIMRFEKFEKFKKKQYYIHEVDLSFHDSYKKFSANNLGLATNSYGTDLKRLKTVILDARDRGYNTNKQVESRKFDAPSEPTMFVTLSEIEIQAIKNHHFEQDYLRNAQDWLIIGCWTGCRVNDLMKLDNNNIMMNNKGVKFIRYTQSKTGKQIDIAIHPHVEEVLERLGSFPRPISDAKFNDYIKKVCQKAGLTQLVKGTRQNPKTHRKETGMFEKWELIKSHTCRRSFATNHYNKLSNKIIMKVTGHSTEGMLLTYIGETENNHMDEFMQLYNTEQDNEIKSIKTA
jgi:integrase